MYMASARSTDAADCTTVCYMVRTRNDDGLRSEVGSGATTEETSSQQFPDAARTGGLHHEVVYNGSLRGRRGYPTAGQIPANSLQSNGHTLQVDGCLWTGS